MKKIIFILAAGFVACTSSAYAQVIKLGHISTANLLQLMPEVKKSDSVLASYQKALEDQNATMLKEYQGKMNDYDLNVNKSKVWSDAVIEVKANEIKDLEKRIQEFQQGAQEKLSNKKQEIYAPILKKAEDAIKAVGKENNYTYIFDVSPGGSVIYSQDSDDIMPLVKKKLGLK